MASCYTILVYLILAAEVFSVLSGLRLPEETSSSKSLDRLSKKIAALTKPTTRFLNAAAGGTIDESCIKKFEDCRINCSFFSCTRCYAVVINCAYALALSGKTPTRTTSISSATSTTSSSTTSISSTSAASSSTTAVSSSTTAASSSTSVPVTSTSARSVTSTTVITSSTSAMATNVK